MVFSRPRSWRGAASTPSITSGQRRVATGAAVGGLVILLSACSPISTWRHLTGLDRNDPNPATTPNSKNLAAAEKKPYPNLASVPPPPTEAMTAAERQKLADSLIADLHHPKYNDEGLKPGFPAGVDVPPPPPALPPGLAAAASKPDTAEAEAAGGNAKVAMATPGGARKPTSGLRKAGEPPLPGPMESSLHSPQIHGLPVPGRARPAPAAPHVRPEGPPASHIPSGALASAEPEAPPPPPTLPGLLSGPAPAKLAHASAPPKPRRLTVATIGFPGTATTLSPGAQPVLAKIVQFYKKRPANIRIVGYTGPVGNSPLAQLNRFSAALDRAQTVAAALTKAGIPASKIHVEAAPAGADLGAGHAEVQFIY